MTKTYGSLLFRLLPKYSACHRIEYIHLFNETVNGKGFFFFFFFYSKAFSVNSSVENVCFHAWLLHTHAKKKTKIENSLKFSQSPIPDPFNNAPSNHLNQNTNTSKFTRAMNLVEKKKSIVYYQLNVICGCGIWPIEMHRQMKKLKLLWRDSLSSKTIF